MSLDAPSQASPPIASLDELVDWFRQGEKPVSARRVGLETEKLGVFAESGRPAPLTGERSIATVLEALARETGGTLLVEQGVPMGVKLAQSSIALEPGGQLELSGEPSVSLAALGTELSHHLAMVRKVSAPLGLEWVASGYRPFGPRAEVPWLPRFRYQLMRQRLPGALAHDMMQMTASVQANFDFASEEDLSGMLATASRASPLVAALTANSPVVDGNRAPWKSFRYRVWKDVDQTRCGLLRVMHDGFTYRRYVEWALDVPLLFVRRGGAYLDPRGVTLRDVLRDGFEGEPASHQDFIDLLSTLFPEIRVKRVVEVRGSDAVDAPETLAVAALWTGLLYDDEAREEVRELVSVPFEALVAFQVDVARDALASRLAGISTQDLAGELVRIAARGLWRRFARGEAADERLLLEPLLSIADSGVTPADRQIATWERTGGVPAAFLSQLAY